MIVLESGRLQSNPKKLFCPPLHLLSERCCGGRRYRELYEDTRLGSLAGVVNQGFRDTEYSF